MFRERLTDHTNTAVSSFRATMELVPHKNMHVAVSAIGSILAKYPSEERHLIEAVNELAILNYDMLTVASKPYTDWRDKPRMRQDMSTNMDELFGIGVFISPDLLRDIDLEFKLYCTVREAMAVLVVGLTKVSRQCR